MSTNASAPSPIEDGGRPGRGSSSRRELAATHTRAQLARVLPLASCLFPIALLSACGTNQRTLVITSEPAGALVHVNDVQLGETPLEAEFTWFGVYDVRLSKPGFEPLVTTAKADPNLHDQPVFDFFSEVFPGTRETTVRWHFTLDPADTDQDALLERARDIRERMNGAPEPRSDE